MADLALPVAPASILSDLPLLVLVNAATLAAVVLFAGALAFAVARRGHRRRMEEQRRAVMARAAARIVHQLRNPVQTMVLHADLLDDPAVAASPDSRAELCGALVSEAQRLTGMLQSLSVYATGAGRHLSREPTPLHELARAAVAGAGGDGRVRVDARLSEGAALVDPYYLRQALDAVIANAREAVAERSEGRVTVSVETRGELLDLAVADNGRGIEAERVEELFAPFVSGTGRGMGLGLTLCREIVEAHGGRVEIRSRPGEGTTVHLLLPRVPPLRENAPTPAVAGGPVATPAMPAP